MAAAAPPPQLLDTIANLAAFHREHEKFYSQAPLRTALAVQAASRMLKALADVWRSVQPLEHPPAAPFTGARDINAPGLVAESGVLFMESEGEPPEIAGTRRDLAAAAEDLERTGAWLASAMEHSWTVAGALCAFPQLAGELGERHRIIANDWQAASLQTLIARLLRRALEILDKVDFRPTAIRADLSGDRDFARYLYSASELLDRAADLLAESAALVHDNERRWRVFAARVAELSAEAPAVA